MPMHTRCTPRFLLSCALLMVLLPAGLFAQPAFLVKDIDPYPFTVSPFKGEMVAAGGLVFIPLDDGIHGNELWRSDGTEAGTYLLTDICPGICSSYPSTLTPFGGSLYFLAGGGLWKTDGTKAGTVQVLG